jgi:hypothetical protein
MNKPRQRITYLNVEAALPLRRQRRGVEIELYPVDHLAAAVLVLPAVPLPLPAGRGGCVGAAEREARRPRLGRLRQQRRLQRHHLRRHCSLRGWSGAAV